MADRIIVVDDEREIADLIGLYLEMTDTRCISSSTAPMR